MHKLRYKLIVSDLDGTLLNNRGKITERTLKAISDYHALGGRFTYATGRSEDSADVFVKQTGIKTPGIAFNGGKVVNHTDGKVIYETFLDAGASKKAYTALRKLDKNVIVYLDKSRHVAEYTKEIDKYLERVRQGVQIIRDIDQVIHAEVKIKKLLVIDPAQEEDAIINTVKPIFGETFNCVKSDPIYYEFLPPDTTKGHALAVLAGYLGIDLSAVIAVGDHLNDVPMIKTAGLGVAVANAEQEALDAAGYITASNNDDGVAILIEKILAGEDKWGRYDFVT